MRYNNTGKKAKKTKPGSDHWLLQRVSAVVLLPLNTWFVVQFLQRSDDSYAEVAAWIAQPLTAAGVQAYFLIMLWHAYLGLRVVMEDYVSPIGGQREFQIGIIRHALIIYFGTMSGYLWHGVIW